MTARHGTKGPRNFLQMQAFLQVRGYVNLTGGLCARAGFARGCPAGAADLRGGPGVRQLGAHGQVSRRKRGRSAEKGVADRRFLA
jgi:hypothetical protein